MPHSCLRYVSGALETLGQLAQQGIQLDAVYPPFGTAALCDLLEQDINLSKEPFELYEAFIGKKYGDPTEASLVGILLMAEKEGILLDPVYSGKMFAAFLAHCAAAKWRSRQNILLVHSGDVPALFAYQQVIEAHLQKRGRY